MKRGSAQKAWDAVRASLVWRYLTFLLLIATSLAMMPYHTGLPVTWGIVVGVIGISVLATLDLTKARRRRDS